MSYTECILLSNMYLIIPLYTHVSRSPSWSVYRFSTPGKCGRHPVQYATQENFDKDDSSTKQLSPSTTALPHHHSNTLRVAHHLSFIFAHIALHLPERGIDQLVQRDICQFGPSIQ